ncbi:ribosome-binding factor A [Patescibacteria group bacterium]|nr:MAG: ribosome-binding factor A [Patescibacteria group bacterium]
MEVRTEKIKDIIKTLAAQFLQIESNGTSLITVTDVVISDDGKSARILFSVFPEGKEKGVLDFVKRKRSEFRQYVKDNSRLMRIPFFDFIIDIGEKNRQNIDRISNSVQ